MVDQFVSDGAVDVISPVGEGGLSGANSQHDPVGLHVGKIVENNATNCHGSQAHRSRWFGDGVEFGVLGVEGERNKCLESTSLILQIP